MPEQDTFTPPSLAQGDASIGKPAFRWQLLVAPLMAVSLLLHGVLLFVPLPSREVVPEEELEEEVLPGEEEEAVDILSLSDITPPEPPPEEAPPPEQPAEAPPPTGAVPPPPDPEQLDELPPAEEFEEEFIEDEEFYEDEELPPSGFDAARQQALLGQTGNINVEFDKTSEFPGNVDGLRGGPGEWDPGKIACFFTAFDPSSNDFALLPSAQQLKFFTRNNGLIINDDLPATFPSAAIYEDSSGYCGEPLYVVEENGEIVMLVSVIPVGVGGSSGLLIFWSSDPRVS